MNFQEPFLKAWAICNPSIRWISRTTIFQARYPLGINFRPWMMHRFTATILDSVDLLWTFLAQIPLLHLIRKMVKNARTNGCPIVWSLELFLDFGYGMGYSFSFQSWGIVFSYMLIAWSTGLCKSYNLSIDFFQKKIVVNFCSYVCLQVIQAEEWKYLQVCFYLWYRIEEWKYLQALQAILFSDVWQKMLPLYTREA